MYTDNLTHTLGDITLGISSLLGGYYLILKIKDYYKESPDPKLTYATIEELKDIKLSHNQSIKETKSDLYLLKSEIKQDIHTLFKEIQKTLKLTQSFVQKNAQHIAALITQTNTNHQRITELSIKTDRLSEKFNLSPKS